MRTRLFISLVLGSLIIGFPAQAQSKKELAAQNFQLSQRLTALENRMLTGDPAAERLMQRTDALEASQRSLTGEVERLRYERDTLQTEVKTLAGEIAALQTLAEEMKRHLKAVEMAASVPQSQIGQQFDPLTGAPIYGGAAGSVLGGGVYGGGVYSDGSSLPPPPVILNGPTASLETYDMTKLAQVGLEKLNQGDFSGSQSAFIQYLEYNPDAVDRGDVHFWLGETYYAKGGFADAADAYIASMRAAPNGPFAPEAMVRLAGTARALGNTPMACQTLASFPTQYPGATPDVREKARVESTRSGC
jgi:tol-pal system protein YbgF